VTTFALNRARNENQMKNYEHTQPGVLMRLILGAMAVVMGTIGIVVLTSTRKPEAAIGLLVAPVVLAILLVLFHSLTIRISKKTLNLSFGVGLIRKSFSIEEIDEASAVSNRWHYGWGIKKIKGGWLYNVSGFDAVEIKLKNGRTNRIGTDEPKKLLAAINSAMENDPKA